MDMQERDELLARLTILGNQVPWLALIALADTLEEGLNGKYANNPLEWRKQTAFWHIDHANEHHFAHCRGDKTEPHIAHFITRMMMAGEKLLEADHVSGTH